MRDFTLTIIWSGTLLLILRWVLVMFAGFNYKLVYVTVGWFIVLLVLKYIIWNC